MSKKNPRTYSGFAVGVADGRRRVADPDHAPVVAHHPVLERERLAGADALHGLAPRSVAVLRMDPLRPLVTLGPGGASEQVVDLRAHEEVAEALVGHVDVRHDRELLDERAVALLDVGGSGLGLPLARDVDDEADPVSGAIFRRVDVDRFVADPDDAVVGRHQPVFREIRFPGGVGGGVGRLHALPIVGVHDRVPEVSRLRRTVRADTRSTSRSGGSRTRSCPSSLRFRRTPRPAWTRARDGSRGRGSGSRAHLAASVWSWSARWFARWVR